MIIDTRNIYPDLHITNYNYFLLHQYNLKIDGLWVHNNQYYILCSEFNNSTLALDGTSLKEWFRNHSIIGSYTHIVNNIPDGATRVPTPKIEDIANFSGSPRNFTFLLNDILSIIPKDFPSFKLQDKNSGVIYFVTEKPLDSDQESILNDAIHKMRISIRIETCISNNLDEIYQPLLDEVMVFRHNKTFIGLKGTKAIKVWEADEDFWNDKRGDLLKPSTKKTDFYPKNFNTNLSSCIISDSIKPPNLRNFLTLYGTVYLNLPILEHDDSYWQSLGVTEEELLKLIEMNRVKLLLTQPLHRYNPRILDILWEHDESTYLTPRRLSSITISDLRNRNPVLFPTFNDEIKYELLHQLYHKNILSHLPNGLDRKTLTYLSNIWGNYLEDVHRTGVHGLSRYSSYHFLDGIFKSVGKDYGVELLDSIPSVDFGAALQANVVPKYWEGYSDEKIITTVANLYSGIPNNIIPKNFPYSNTSVDKVLVINSDVPIIDLAQSFTHHDIDRFRNLIFGLTKHKKDQNELDRSLKLFNEHVINFEKSNNRLNTLDVSGFVIDSTLAVADVNVPLASWVVNTVGKFLTQIGVKSGTVQKLVDEFTAIKTGTALPDAVLVARMRKQLKEKWFQSKLRKIGF